MDKILVGIHIPAVHEQYDAFVPLDAEISELTSIIANGVSEITDGKYSVSGLEMLSLQDPEYLLDPRLTLRDYNVRDGMQLWLL